MKQTQQAKRTVIRNKENVIFKITRHETWSEIKDEFEGEKKEKIRRKVK